LKVIINNIVKHILKRRPTNYKTQKRLTRICKRENDESIKEKDERKIV